jgi:hypothetical protein
VRDGEATTGVEVTVTRGWSIAGRVELPAGAPADGVRALRLIAWESKTNASGHARAAADGTFRIAALAEGRFAVSALECPPGYALSPTFDVPAGTTDLVLRLLPALTIAGRVVDAAGAPARANVHAWPARQVANALRMHPTDADGRFELSVAPDFTGSIRASHVDNMFVQGTVEGVIAGAKDVVVRLGTPLRR